MWEEIANDYKDVKTTYTHPCAHMTIVSTVQQLAHEQLKIRIVFPDETYEEIQNVKDFSFESLWGSVGGFVGIFLGYNLMQLPDLLLNAFKYIKQNIVVNMLGLYPSKSGFQQV